MTLLRLMMLMILLKGWEWDLNPIWSRWSKRRRRRTELIRFALTRRVNQRPKLSTKDTRYPCQHRHMKNCHLHLNLLFHVMTQLECNAHSNSGNHTVSWCVILVSSVLNYCRSVRYHHHGMEVSNSKSPNPILVNAQQADSPAPDCPKRRFHAPQTKQLAGRGVSCGRTWSCLGSLALIWLKDLISRSCNPHSNAPLPSQLKASKFLALFLACWKLKSWDTYMRLRDVRCLKPPGKYWHKY